MAFLKKILDKATFLLVVGIWNSLSAYLLKLSMLPFELTTLIITIGNLVIVWLGIESGHVNNTQVETPKP